MVAGSPDGRLVDWACRGSTLRLGGKTSIMGVLNVTPDSFSDGGRYRTAELAAAHAETMIRAGVDIVDIGGESTRPGAAPVTADEECERVLPVIRALAKRCDALISVDTAKAAVARRALQAGAHVVNDVSALGDPGMAAVVAEYRAGLVLMHMQGRPQTMQSDPRYDDVVADVCAYLRERIEAARRAGIADSAVAVDPGIGFGKTLEHNLRLLVGLPRLAGLGRPVVVGLSRKSMLGVITGRDVQDRLAASLAGLVYAIVRGAHILRVHDVKESCDAAAVVDTLRREERDGDVVDGQTGSHGLERAR